MPDMASFDEQMPCIGIFSFDPQEHRFFDSPTLCFNPNACLCIIIRSGGKTNILPIISCRQRRAPQRADTVGRVGRWKNECWKVLGR